MHKCNLKKMTHHVAMHETFQSLMATLPNFKTIKLKKKTCLCNEADNMIKCKVKFKWDFSILDNEHVKFLEHIKR